MTDAADRGGPPGGAPRRGRRGKGYFLPGAVALVALLVIGAAIGAGDLSHRPPEQLAGPDVAREIALGIQTNPETRSEGLGGPSNGRPMITCPPEVVRAGLRFTCTLAQSAGRADRTVYVTEVDGRGHLRWSLGP